MSQLTQQLLGKSHEHDGTPDESTTRAAGISARESERALVVGAYADVLDVDAGLPTVIQQAIDSLRGPAMTFVRTSASVSAYIQPFGFERRCFITDLSRSVSASLRADAVLPATVSASAACAQTLGAVATASLTLSQSTPNSVVFDTSGTFLQEGAGGAGASGSLSFERAGTLTIDSQGPDVRANLAGIVGPDYVDQVIIGRTFTVAIVPGTRLGLSMGFNVPNAYNSSINGHVVVTFTPQ